MDTMTMPSTGTGRKALAFGRHFLEMCIPMCVVGVPLSLLVLGALPAGDAPFRSRYPEIALLVAAATLTLPMAAWMLFRGMPARPTLEMSAAAFVVALALIAAVAVGVLGDGWIRLSVSQFCGLVCVAMAGVMLLRLDLYTGHAAHHAAPGRSAG